MGVHFHSFRSNSPNTTDNAQLVQILSAAERTGGMTPRIARDVISQVLGKQLPPFKFPDQLNPDLPFSLAMAQAVKNVGNPAEVGQQLTALKALGVIGEESTDTEIQKVLGDFAEFMSRKVKALKQEPETDDE